MMEKGKSVPKKGRSGVEGGYKGESYKFNADK